MKSTSILSQRVNCVTHKQVVDTIFRRVKQRRRALVFAMNTHILVELSKDPLFKRRHDKADIIFADGAPLVWISKITPTPLPERVSGTDLAEQLLKSKNARIFLLGSTDKILEKMRRIYSHSVSGYYSPPFKKRWGSKENQKIIKLINKSKADIIIVCLGSLKQERWLVNNLAKIDAIIGIGVGSALEILSGEKPRAPRFMKDNGFEWLWRLLLEPKRLTRRHIGDFLYILKLAKRELTIKLTERFST